MHIRTISYASFAFFSLVTALGCAVHPVEVAHQKSAPATEKARPGRVLFLLTAAQIQTLANGKTRPTGFFLNEFLEPFSALQEAGYQVEIATPKGRPPAVDPESLKPRYWPEGVDPKALWQEVSAMAAIQTPLSLEDAELDLASYQGLVVPGGQGVMVDLLNNPQVSNMVHTFLETHRPLGLICHSPALLAQRPSTSTRARRVTSVSWAEEIYIETLVMSGQALNRDIGHQLDEAGFEHRAAFPGQPHAIRDGFLVTSQNPFSGKLFVTHYLAALEDWRGLQIEGERP